MRKISTLFLLLLVIESSAQMADTARIVIINCWGNKMPPVKPLSETLEKSMPSCFIVPAVKTDTTKKPIIIGLHCQRTITTADSPLIIIDGIPVDNERIKDLNPNDIQNIEILNNAVATAIFGSRAVNGVICITMKQNTVRKFIIKDFLEGSPVVGATVSFIDVISKDIVMSVTNDTGLVVANKLKWTGRYKILVSAVGYQSIDQIMGNSYTNKPQNILLTRDIKKCDEVVLTATEGKRRRSCCTCFSVRRTRYGKAIDSTSHQQPITVFPNPVQKGSVLNIRLRNIDEKIKMARIINAEGREISRQNLEINKRMNHFQLSTDLRWATGIYFVQLVYENGRVLASGKIIIQ
ncbi:MAG: TonB-dependent receptor plug domain-containing protein [Bacteroidota bacterium]